MKANLLAIGEFLVMGLDLLVDLPFRCVSTGRTCEGYENSKGKLSPSTQKNTPPSLESFPLVKTSGTLEERRAFHFFLSEAVPNIAGVFEPTFWTHGVIQLAQTEPAIRYAVQALSAIYAQGTERAINQVPGMNDFALTSYNKAIRALLIRDSSANERKLITLVTCVLFVCFEFMRGEVVAAVGHITGGLKLLNEWQPSQSSAKPDESSISPYSDLCDGLTSMFMRLQLQAAFSTHASPSSWHSIRNPKKWDDEEILSFCSFTEARNKLSAIGNECVSTILPFIAAKYARQIDMKLIIRRMRLEKKLRTWRRTFESSIAIKKSTSTTQRAAAVNLLLMFCISMTIWAAVCFDIEEMNYDNCKEEYEDIVALAKNVMDARIIGNGFQFEVGIIPHLHNAGLKCRFPDLRQEIIDILSSKHWREGIFDSKVSCRLIELTKRIEEENVDPDTGLPIETARIHFVDQKHCIGRSPENGDRKVVFYLKPHGPYGPWLAREELLNENISVARVVNMHSN